MATNTMHLRAAGERLALAPGTSRWQSYGNGYCEGDIRALYARDKAKRWFRAGGVCTRCGVVELDPGLIGHERDSYARHRNKLDVTATYAGQLAAADGVDTTTSTLDTPPPAGRCNTETGQNGRRAVDVARDLEDLHAGGRGSGAITLGAGGGVSTPPGSAGVDTPPRWDPSAQVTCPDCDGTITASNLSRHRKRAHG